MCAKQPCGRFHANQGIVLGVLVGINRIVEQGPSDSSQVQDEGWGVQSSGLSGPGQQGAPVERKTQKDLRPPREAFGKRIDHDRAER